MFKQKILRFAYLLRKGELREALYRAFSFARDNALNIRFESYLVFQIRSRPIEIIQPKAAVRIQKFGPEDSDMDRLVRFWPESMRYSRTDRELTMSLKADFKNGDECFCAMFNGEIVSMAWIGYQNNYMLKSLAKKIGLKKKEAIIQRGYTREGFRGKRIYSFLLSSLCSYCFENQLERCYSYVGVRNAASISVHKKIFDSWFFMRHMQVILLGYVINFFPDSYRMACSRNVRESRDVNLRL